MAEPRLTWSPPIKVATAKITPWRPEWADLLANLLDGDHELSARLPIPQPYTLQDAQRFIARHANIDQFPALRWRVYAIVDTGTDAPVGNISVTPKGWDPMIGEVGYWVARPFRGQHVASQALAQLVQRHIRDWARWEIACDVNNLPSQRIAERAGFVREGVLRSWFEVKGVRRDFVMYSLLERDVV